MVKSKHGLQGPDQKSTSGKVGRPTIFKDSGVLLEDLINLYEKYGTIEAVAKHLGIHRSTAYKYLKHYLKPPKREFEHYGQFAKWIRDNPNVKLPQDVKKIAEITGCSYSSIASYLRRRKVLAAEVTKDIPMLAGLPLILRNVKGQLIPAKRLLMDEVFCDFTNMRYVIKGEDLFGMHHEFNISARVLRAKLKQIGVLK